MTRIRRFAAIFALAAMTLSLSEGLLATACAEEGAMPAMAAHDGHAATTGAPASPGPDGTEDAPRCPMSTAAVSACAATAIATTPSVAVPAAPVNSARPAPLLTHVPASFVTLGLFRPPIA